MRDKIERIINGHEQHLFYISIHNAGFALKECLNKEGLPNGKGVYIYDTCNECRHNENIFTKPGEIVKELQDYLIKDTLAFLKHENEKHFGWNIKSFPNTIDRWQRNIDRKDLQEFISAYQQDIAILFLLSDKERIDEKVNLKYIAQEGICLRACEAEFTEIVKKAYSIVNEEKEYLYGKEYNISPCICFDENNDTYILLTTEERYNTPVLIPFTKKEKEEIVNMHYENTRGNV